MSEPDGGDIITHAQQRVHSKHGTFTRIIVDSYVQICVIFTLICRYSTYEYSSWFQCIVPSVKVD